LAQAGRVSGMILADDVCAKANGRDKSALASRTSEESRGKNMATEASDGDVSFDPVLLLRATGYGLLFRRYIDVCVRRWARV
jgi:hypothetical protein